MTKQAILTHSLVAIVFVGIGYYLGNTNKPITVKGPAQVTEKGDTLVVTQHPSPSVTIVKKIYQPDPNSTVITTDTKGNITVKVRHIGYGLQPGIGFGYADRTRFVVDARILYWDRLGLNPLVALSFDHDASFMHLGLALSYALPFEWTSNTSIFLGLLENKEVIGGLRWKF